MNGIAGLLCLDDRPMESAEIEAVIGAAPHATPHGVLRWNDNRAAFIRFPFPTTPEAQRAAREPIQSVGSPLVVCFDGRLDGRSALAAHLDAADRTSELSDAELIRRLWLAHGDRCLSWLRGDFAFAVWHSATQRLVCARSPMGWRPLHWCHTSRYFGFATEPRMLLRGLDLSREINEPAAAGYLSTRFNHRTHTLWQQMHVLPGGAAMEVINGRRRMWHWYEPPLDRQLDLPLNEHVHRLSALLDESVADAIRSTGPVVVHLSGGIDSSSVLSRAVGLARSGAIASMPVAMSVRYPGEAFDESPWSLAVERHLGIHAVAIHPSLQYDWDLADEWVARSSHLPLRPNVATPMMLSPAWRDVGACVRVTGEGGDDWFSGTLEYLATMILDREFGKLTKALRDPGLAASPLRRLWRLGRCGIFPLMSRARRAQITQPLYVGHRRLPPFVNAAWANSRGVWSQFDEASAAASHPSIPARLRSPMANLNNGRRYIDWHGLASFSASRGVEVRHPLHDMRLVEHIFTVPGPVIFRHDQPKWLLREAMRGGLPENVRRRSSKANFSDLIPLAILSRVSPSSAATLEPVRRGWIDATPLMQMLDAQHRWLQAGRPGPIPHAEWLASLWAVVSLDTWLKKS